MKKHQHIIQKAQAQGAELVYAGGVTGNLVAPHVFVNVAADSEIVQNESFGPILPILKAADTAHALHS